MAHLRDISGAVTAITGILTIIQGFSATTALMTTATAAGSINPIIAGLGFGALGVTAMEATGITGFQYDLTGGKQGKQGLIEQAGATTAQIAKTAGKDVGASAIKAGTDARTMIDKIVIESINLSHDYTANDFMNDLTAGRIAKGVPISR